MNDNFFKDNQLHIEGLVALRSLQKYITNISDNDINKYVHGLVLMKKNIELLLKTIAFNHYSPLPLDLKEIYLLLKRIDDLSSNL